jgi:hypothetical protein
MTTTLLTSRLARVAVVGLAIVAVAGCSSDAKKSDAPKPKKIERAASVKPEATSTTSAAAPAAPAGPACTTAAAAVALSPDRVTSITCSGEFAAGAASNSQYDYAYLLQSANGAWQKASQSVQTEVCTTNPQGLPASFVAAACDD